MLVGEVTSDKVTGDGKTLATTSVMKHRDDLKYIKVPVKDVDEIKIEVNDGGNGNGSDYATFGDAKLHFVDESRIDKTELTNLVNEVKELNEDDYTEESFNVMQIVLAKAEEVLEDNNASQDTVDNLTMKLQELVESLTVINLDEIVNIPDKYLAKSLSRVLGKSKGFTIGDMRSLTELSLSGVTNLEAGIYRVHVLYEDEELSGTLINMALIR